MAKISLSLVGLLFFDLILSLSSQVACLNRGPYDAFLPPRLAQKTSAAHFVLVHGAGHGAWCWYKLTAMLETAGHNVTAIDLGGCGINPKRLNEVWSVQDYAEPLMKAMESVPEGQKVVLVSHSLGGLAAILALEAYAEKISLGVFVAAVVVPPGTTLYQLFSQTWGGFTGDLYDTKYSYDDGPEHEPTSVIFGPLMLAHRLYQNCPLQDLKLGSSLLRETRIFKKENTTDVAFTRERYGSMPRVFASCGDDALADGKQQAVTSNGAELDEVDVIEGADHMAMLSRPKELFRYLLRVTRKFT